jgi:hypothetical protein
MISEGAGKEGAMWRYRIDQSGERPVNVTRGGGSGNELPALVARRLTDRVRLGPRS